MKFGQVPMQQLEGIDLRLPEDPAENAQVLAGAEIGALRVYFGCTAWGNKNWIGSLYPPKTKAADFLSHYAQQFQSVELNTTHYRIPSEDQVLKWADQVPDGFEFCPKVYQAISHWDRLNDQRGTTERFCEAISHFKDHLGSSFLQLRPDFGIQNMERLQHYMQRWPIEIPLAVELRHESWFDNHSHQSELFSLLQECSKTAVITDTAGRRDLLHMRLVSNSVMIRFVGNQLHASDYQRIDEWVERLRHWQQIGLRRCYFFMHQHEELHSPALIQYMSKKLSQYNDIEATIPTLQNQAPAQEQGSLF